LLYPQQNLARNKLDLSGIWDFKIDPDLVGEQQGWQNGVVDPRPIAVPGSWNEQYEDIYNYLGLAWYIKSTYIPPYWRGQRVFLRVGSACYFGTVYINGVKMGSHEGGHLPFAFEITDQIRWEAENIIAISVENELKPTRVPSGNMGAPLLPIASFPHTT
jgi:beta-glucuronidase